MEFDDIDDADLPAPEPGSPEYIIENAFVMIEYALDALIAQGRKDMAREQLSTLIQLFKEDLYDLAEKAV